MSELIDDIKNYLVAQGIAIATNVFLDSMPDEPNNCITIYEYPGKPGYVSMTNRNVQISLRNSAYSTGKTLINSIRNLLDDKNPEQIITLNVSRKAVFRALQEPFKLRIDSKKRVIFACNFSVRTVRD